MKFKENDAVVIIQGEYRGFLGIITSCKFDIETKKDCYFTQVLNENKDNVVCHETDIQLLEEAMKESPTNYMEPTTKYESVDHPTHYHPGDYEAIKVIEAWLGPEGCYHFCMGNAIKYISRLDKKPSADKSKNEKTIEDIGKTIWYLEYAKKMKSKMQ